MVDINELSQASNRLLLPIISITTGLEELDKSFKLFNTSVNDIVNSITKSIDTLGKNSDDILNSKKNESNISSNTPFAITDKNMPKEENVPFSITNENMPTKDTLPFNDLLGNTKNKTALKSESDVAFANLLQPSEDSSDDSGSKKNDKSLKKSTKGFGKLFKGIGKSLGPMYFLIEILGKLDILEPIFELFGAFISILGVAFLPVITQLTEAFIPLIPVFMDFALALQPFVGIICESIAYVRYFDQGLTLLNDGLKGATVFLTNSVTGFDEWADNVSNSVREGLDSFGHFVKDSLTWIFNDMGDWIIDLFKNMWENIKDSAGDIAGQVFSF